MAKILLIDEDVALLAALGSRLEEAGYGVVKTSQPDHHEVLMAEEQPDLVVMEVHLNNDSGWALLEKLAKQLPVIILSMNGNEEDVVRGLSYGALDYVTKPYRSEELIARLRLRLSQRAAAAGTPDLTATAASAETSEVSAEADPAENASASAPAEPEADPAETETAATAGQLPAESSTEAEASTEKEASVAEASTEKEASVAEITASPAREPDSDAVFMSEAEELSLLRMQGDEQKSEREPLPPQGADSQVSLGQQFNLERQRRRLTLVQAESELKVPMSYLQAIEDDKFTLLPRGPIATQMVRQYADYLNLDTAYIVQEFQLLYYADPAEPHPALGGPRLRRTLPNWLAPAVAVMLALVISIGGLYYFDRDGVNTAVSNLRSLVLPQESEAAPPAPTITPTTTPTEAPESSGTAESEQVS